jgi:predicted ATP-binding protein involved in virulence
MSTSYIKSVEINKLWGKYDIVWDNLHPDVNVLVGINGSGKSTLLKIIYAAISHDEKIVAKFKFESARILNQNNWHQIRTTPKNQKEISGVGYENEFVSNFEFISTFDVTTNKSKLKSDESPLSLELRNLILQTGYNSFNDYRLKATQSSEKAIEINNRIEILFEIINKYFEVTGKTIQIDSTNKLIFETGNDFIGLEHLSAGEKQLLFILFKVFLMEEKPSVLMLDEPEISMHLAWQQDLIQTLRTLNPNCQLIIATHSPSIFGKGWGDKITFMENLFVK